MCRERHGEQDAPLGLTHSWDLLPIGLWQCQTGGAEAARAGACGVGGKPCVSADRACRAHVVEGAGSAPRAWRGAARTPDAQGSCSRGERPCVQAAGEAWLEAEGLGFLFWVF